MPLAQWQGSSPLEELVTPAGFAEHWGSKQAGETLA